MKFKGLTHWAQESLVLLAIGGALIGVYLLREKLLVNSVPESQSPFSAAREQGDEAFLKQDWPTAVSNYRQLTEQDPFNGYAWFSLAEATWNNVRRLINERDRMTRATVPDPKRLEELSAEILARGHEAIGYLDRARETGRFRNLAGAKMAAIHTALGEKDEAIRLLTRCYEDGMVLQGMWMMRDFVALRTEPAFEELANRDRRAYNRDAGPLQSPIRGEAPPTR